MNPWAENHIEWPEPRGWTVSQEIIFAKSITAWRIACIDLHRMREALHRLGPTASVRTIAGVLKCSKPTVFSFIRSGFIRRCRRRRGARQRAPLAVETASVVEFAALCRADLDRPPHVFQPFARVRARLERDGPAGVYRALATRPSLAEVALFMRCSESTVLRMIRSRYFRCRRRSLHRWDIWKKDLPFWCREKKSPNTS